MGLNPEGRQSAETEPEKSHLPKGGTTDADHVEPRPRGDIPIEQGVHPDGSGTAQTGPPPQ